MRRILLIVAALAALLTPRAVIAQTYAPCCTNTATVGAAWNTSKVRYYFVDNESGNDNRACFREASAGTVFTGAQADAVKCKTAERIREILPRNGNGRRAVILFKPRSDGGNYLDKSGASDSLDLGYLGYVTLIFRGSDLTNSINDRIDLGGVVEPTTVGPNPDGSWTAAGAMAGKVVSVSAGTLPTQDALAGLKLQFDGNVTTGLRTIGSMALYRASGTTFEIPRTQTMAAGDTFTLRRPGVKFVGLTGPLLGANGPLQDTTILRGTVVAGFEFTAASLTWTVNGPLVPIFIRTQGLSLGIVNGSLSISSVYWDATNTSRTVLTALDVRGAGTISGPQSPGVSSSSAVEYCAFHSTAQLQKLNGDVAIGSGSLFLGELRVIGAPRGTSADLSFSTLVVGSNLTTNSSARLLAGARVWNSGVQLKNVDVSGSTASIRFLTVGGDSFIDGVQGTTAVGVNVFDVSGSWGSQFQFGSSMTAAAGAGGSEIVLSGTVTKTFAGLASDSWDDSQGNHVRGSGGAAVKRITSGTFANVPVLGADPASPANGDTWLTDIAGTRKFCARMSGVTYCSTLSP